MDLSSSIKAGPFLNFGGIDDHYFWKTSILIVINKSNDPPHIIVNSQLCKPFVLNLCRDYNNNLINQNFIFDYQFLCYDTMTKQTETEQTITYQIYDQSFNFVIPGKDQYPHILYTTCNNYNPERYPKKGGFQTNWREVLLDHEKNKLHLSLTGGDQIYGDDVLFLPSIKQWLLLKNQHDLFTTYPYTKEMDLEVLNFYVELYIHYMTAPYYSTLLASVHFLNTLDDHEIFDGCGSFPPILQKSPVFQGIFHRAYQMYLLFQHHTTLDKINTNFKVHNGHSTLRHAGPVSILAIDHRADRNKSRILSKESTNQLFEQLNTLKSDCKHLLIMSSIPIVFPNIHLASQILEWGNLYEKKPTLLRKLSRIIDKIIGLNPLSISIASENIFDQWGSYSHIQERNEFITQLTSFAQTRFNENKPLRITLLSGDTHMASAGHIHDNTHLKNIPIINNPNSITQLTSSGIGSVFGHTLAYKIVYTLLNFMSSLPKQTKITNSIFMNMIPWKKNLFWGVVKQNHSFFISQRNWLKLNFITYDQNRTDMIATLCTESPCCTLNKRSAPITYSLTVPGLIL